LRSVAGDAALVELDFLPYLVRGVQGFRRERGAGGFVVAGSDLRYHVFAVSRSGSVASVVQHSIAVLLPEFEPPLPQREGASLCIDVAYLANSMRLIAEGRQRGLVRISVQEDRAEHQLSDSCVLDGPITSVLFFQPRRDTIAPRHHVSADMSSSSSSPTSARRRPTLTRLRVQRSRARRRSQLRTRVAYSAHSDTAELLAQLAELREQRAKFAVPSSSSSSSSSSLSSDDDANDDERVDLLVCGAIGFALVFRNVLRRRLSDPVMLPVGAAYDAVSCACTHDLTRSGRVNIVLGTVSGRVLIFEESSAPSPSSYSMISAYSCGRPVRSIRVRSNRGVSLVVSTSLGVHILHVDMQRNLDRILSAARALSLFSKK
jgi:hypothetical protein